jgi:hypothetical protein
VHACLFQGAPSELAWQCHSDGVIYFFSSLVCGFSCAATVPARPWLQQVHWQHCLILLSEAPATSSAPMHESGYLLWSLCSMVVSVVTVAAQGGSATGVVLGSVAQAIAHWSHSALALSAARYGVCFYPSTASFCHSWWALAAIMQGLLLGARTHGMHARSMVWAMAQ